MRVLTMPGTGGRNADVMELIVWRLQVPPVEVVR
jgi:hypothetical protein